MTAGTLHGAGAANPFRLTDDELFADPWTKVRALAWERLRDNVAGLAIGSPELVNLDVRDSLPLAACYGGTHADLQRAPFEGNAVATAVDVETGRLYAAQAESLDLPAQPGPEAAPEEGFGVRQYVLDLRLILGIPRDPATLLVTLLLRDQSSNRQLVRLARSPLRFQDPEVERFLAEQRRSLPPRRVFPPPDGPGVIFGPHDQAPAVPEDRGITLMVDPVSTRKGVKQGWLRGGFRLAVAESDLVRQQSDSLPPGTTAVVGIQILVLGATAVGPHVLAMGVPTANPISDQNGDLVATGHFAIDLMRIRGLPRTDQAWFVYAFSGHAMAGPVLLNAG